MAMKIPLQVFLSYRAQWQTEREALEKARDANNAKDDAEFLIELKFSEGELKENDSIIEFMETMSTARFVILMLGREYFESPYCLHELLEISRNGTTENRLFALPIKCDDSLNKLTKKSFLSCWQGKYEIPGTADKGYCQDRLQELQANIQANKFDGLSNKDRNDIIKDNLEKAFDNTVRPMIDSLVSACHPFEIVDKLTGLAEKVFEREKKDSQKALSEKIVLHLKKLTDEDNAELENIVDLSDPTLLKLAECLLEKKVSDALGVIIKWVKVRSRDIPKNKIQRWRSFFLQVESISGWLLLNSVSNPWLVHNRLYLKAGKKDKSHVELNSTTLAYTEVVICRGILEEPRYSLNSGHDAVPGRFCKAWEGFEGSDEFKLDNVENFVIDSSKNAKLHEVLQVLLYDLKGQPETMSAIPEDLLADLIVQGKAMEGSRYYIVSNNYLKRLEEGQIHGRSILTQINEALRERLVFVCFTHGQPSQPAVDQLQICSEEEKVLLAKLANLLIINKQRTKGH